MSHLPTHLVAAFDQALATNREQLDIVLDCVRRAMANVEEAESMMACTRELMNVHPDVLAGMLTVAVHQIVSQEDTK